MEITLVSLAELKLWRAIWDGELMGFGHEWLKGVYQTERCPYGSRLCLYLFLELHGCHFRNDVGLEMRHLWRLFTTPVT